MAYGIKYKAEYRDKGNNIHKIELLKKGYTGSIATIDNTGSPISINYDNSKDSVINGSMLSFNWLVKDKNTLSDILVSEYKEYQVIYKIDNAVVWTGWLVVDNISSNYLNTEGIYSYSFEANDGLAELKNLRIGEQQGNNSLMYYLKEAIKQNAIELDFKVILNTKPSNNLITSSQNVLTTALLPAERFQEVKEGKSQWWKASEVIENILKVFNCRIFQANNKYVIVNDLEASSKVYEISYSTLQITSTSTNNNVVDISNDIFETSNNYTKQRPLKRVETTLENKFVPVNLVPNGNFNNSDISFWNNVSASLFGKTLTWDSLDTALKVSAVRDTGNDEIFNNVINTNTFAIDSKSEEDKLIVKFDINFKDGEYVNANSQNVLPLNFTVTLVYPDGKREPLQATTLTIGSSAKITKEFFFAQDGNYRLEIKDNCGGSDNSSGGELEGGTGEPTEVTGGWNSVEWQLDNVSIFPVFAGEDSENIVVFDNNFTATNLDSSAIEVEDDDTITIGDAIEANTVSGLRVGSTQTTKWNSFNGNEKIELSKLYLLNKLRRRNVYLNKLNLTLISKDLTVIDFDSKITFDGKLYEIKKYSIIYDYVHYRIKFELVELDTSTFNYSFENFALETIQGESQVTEAVGFEEKDPTVPTYVKNIAEVDIDNWNNKVDKWQIWDSPLTIKGNLTLRDTNNDSKAFVNATTGIYEGENFVFNGVDGSGGSGSGGAGIWGLISGNLSNQTDLWSTLQNINASRINSGTLSTARIPNLSASKITSGTFSNARISSSSVTQHLGNYVDRSTNQSINGNKSFIADTTFDANINLGDLATTTNRHELKLYGNEGGLIRFFTGNVNENIIYTNNGDFNIRNITNSPLNFWTNNSIRTTIAANGNVGIGTTSPSEKLEVNDGEIKVDNGKSTSILTFTENGTNRSYVGQLGDLTTSIPRTVLRNITRGSEIGIIQSSGDIYLSHSGVNADVGLRVVSNGNVGIGTSSPTEKLEVNGVVKATNFVFG